MDSWQRTHFCGDLRLSNVGQTVTLNGWAHRIRDLGGVLFVDLRDRAGLLQLTLDPTKPMPEIRAESCLSVTGVVKERADAAKNPKLPTGDVEVAVQEVKLMGQAKVLPFPISDEDAMESVDESLRVKYRYLDLRRPSMYRKLAIRASLVTKIRAYLDERGFVETETPIITRSTPEGARDYLVAYRLDPGKWYALPQSPQQYKQLLMVAGIERYYQIAKCFRDESQRADRQPEFTQLDLEMSFITQDDVLSLCEGMIRKVINDLISEFGLAKDSVAPFTKLTYDDSMRMYGSDKPDLRFELPLFDATDSLKGAEFSLFKSVIDGGGVVRGVRYPNGAHLSRKEIGALEEVAKNWGAKGMATLIFDRPGEEGHEHALTLKSGAGVRGSIAKFLRPDEVEAIVELSGAQPGDLLCFVAGDYGATHNPLSRLRLEIGEQCGLRDPRKLAYCWIVDFPLVEWDEATKSWSPSHHPFTAPKEADLALLDTDPARVRADCYDMVCNGLEMASGSIRIHRTDVQARIFTLLGIDEKTQKERFGHMLEAFSFGAPPHGGIAPGIDRLIMILTDTENIREVIAFPKMGNGYDPMMDAPSEIDAAQWKELGLTPPKR